MLAYSCAIPQGQKVPVGIVFVHALDGNRLGPHRMFVELAERFNLLGYPTLRFDLSGCGDSTGSVERDSITAEVRDVVQACRFFVARANLEGLVLLGISRGARVSFSAMAEHELPLQGMILLSTPASSPKAAARSLHARLKEYFCKLKDPKHLGKLLTVRAHPRRIWRTLTTAAGLARRFDPITDEPFASRCPVLFIYGRLDPNAAESSRYYQLKCRQNGMPCDCHFIDRANHSFFHYKWKEEIFDLSKQWLERICERLLV